MKSLDRDSSCVAHLLGLLLVFDDQGLAELEQRAPGIVAEIELVGVFEMRDRLFRIGRRFERARLKQLILEVVRVA